MTINERKQLSEYIKSLVRESLDNEPFVSADEETDVPDPSDLKPFGGEMDNPRSHYEGLDELRQITEAMAREAVAGILSEEKKKKRKNKKEKSSSKDKTVISKLNSDGTNAAHYFYKLYGVENGTDAEKAAARSKGYKKAKGKKNDTGVPYKFSSKERNRLGSLLTDR